jgi:hypothetical protein
VDALPLASRSDNQPPLLARFSALTELTVMTLGEGLGIVERLLACLPEGHPLASLTLEFVKPRAYTTYAIQCVASQCAPLSLTLSVHVLGFGPGRHKAK